MLSIPFLNASCETYIKVGIEIVKRSAFVAGVGMTPFTKPGRSASYDEMGEQAARAAIEDAGIHYRDIQQAYASFVYADSTAGQAALYGLGLSGIPIVNVNNNCASGSSALFLARQAVESGAVECAIAVGFEQMVPGALGDQFSDRPAPMTRHANVMEVLQGPATSAPNAAQYFGGAGAEYAETYGTDIKTFAQISVKARRHAARNPNAVFRDELSVEDVLSSPHVFGPLTRFQCCPPTCGGGAAIICSKEFARKNEIYHAVPIIAQSMHTDGPSALDNTSMIELIGAGMARRAAHEVYEASGVSPSDVDVVELHDCFTANELISYEALQLAPTGGAEAFVLDAQNTHGGSVVVNPSGGLLSKGHPLGATGLAQCAELVWQMRDQAGSRQVENASRALQHNLGLGGACVVTLYGRAGELLS